MLHFHFYIVKVCVYVCVRVLGVDVAVYLVYFPGDNIVGVKRCSASLIIVSLFFFFFPHQGANTYMPPPLQQMLNILTVVLTFGTSALAKCNIPVRGGSNSRLCTSHAILTFGLLPSVK